jgi:uncharacterized protein YabN with tetrapyrrole methylase and pyrophosphatase domain
VLSSIPQSLPALLRASMVSERAAKTGFDWDDISGVMAKTMEEWEEFSAEVNNPEMRIRLRKAAMEFGDILFTMVNVARFAHIHPETALIRSIQKFEKRFAYMEEKAIERGGISAAYVAREYASISGMRPKIKSVDGPAQSFIFMENRRDCAALKAGVSPAFKLHHGI